MRVWEHILLDIYVPSDTGGAKRRCLWLPQFTIISVLRISISDVINKNINSFNVM
nr:hypothetical protein LBNOUPBR_LBNOUPBR_CDS_0009 [Gokushovirinae sp.]